VLADAGRAPHRPQPPPGRFRLRRRVPGAVPWVHRVGAQELRTRAAHPPGERLRHRRLR
jgi:hypothetical protein